MAFIIFQGVMFDLTFKEEGAWQCQDTNGRKVNHIKRFSFHKYSQMLTFQYCTAYESCRKQAMHYSPFGQLSRIAWNVWQCMKRLYNKTSVGENQSTSETKENMSQCCAPFVIVMAMSYKYITNTKSLFVRWNPSFCRDRRHVHLKIVFACKC